MVVRVLLHFCRVHTVQGFALLLLALLCSPAPAQTCGLQWLEGTPAAIGPNGIVNAIAKLPNGTAVVGGSFSSAGGQQAGNLARLSGGQWLPAGPGVNGTVWALLTLTDGRLVVAGNFTVAGNPALSNILVYDGTNYLPLAPGPGVNGPVYALTQVGDGGLVIGGLFTNAGGRNAINLARLDAGIWSPVGSGTNDTVWALAADGTTQRGFYVGGNFSSAAGLAGTNGIARFNGTTFQAMGTGCDGTVFAIAVNVAANTVHVGGSFNAFGAITAPNIGVWNGTSWAAAGGSQGLSGPVYALGWGGSTLYVGGSFTVPNAPSSENLALLVGNAFVAQSYAPDAAVYAIRADASGADIGGAFVLLGTRAIPYIARAEPSYPLDLASEVPGLVRALADIPGTLSYVVGGTFSQAGGLPASNIAMWDRTNWSTLGAGVNGTVHAVKALADGRIIAGGEFTLAGSVPARGIAIWNGSTWSSPPSLVGSLAANPAVFALELDAAGNLLVGGSFASAGGVAATANIARLNLTTNTWSALGTGIGSSGSVRAIETLLNNELIIGGASLTIAGQPNKHTGRWNGSAWSVLSSDVNGPVFALVTDGTPNGFIAGGSFSIAGILGAQGIARWAGVAWQRMNSNTSPQTQVYALTRLTSSNRIFAAGSFSTLSTTPVSNIAEWTGSTNWLPVRNATGLEGTSGAVYALQDVGGGAIAGGLFDRAGDFSAGSIAAFSLTGAPSLSVDALPTTVNVGQSSFFFALVPRGYADVTARWQRDGVNIADGAGGASVGGGTVSGAVDVLASPTDGTYAVLVISNTQLSDAGNYRVVLSNACGSTTGNAAALTVSALCDNIDFNGDGLFPDDNDLIDFFSVLAGGTCSTGTCNDIDFNNDDLFPDDVDLVLFLRVLAGGTCP